MNKIPMKQVEIDKLCRRRGNIYKDKHSIINHSIWQCNLTFISINLFDKPFKMHHLIRAYILQQSSRTENFYL